MRSCLISIRVLVPHDPLAQGVQSSIQPGAHGGNLDNKRLGPGRAPPSDGQRTGTKAEAWCFHTHADASHSGGQSFVQSALYAVYPSLKYLKACLKALELSCHLIPEMRLS